MEAPKPKWFKDLRYVDFKIIEEPWNTYKLADGTILRTRMVLTNILVDGDFGERIKKARVNKEKVMKLNLAIQAGPAMSLQIPATLRRSPSPPSRLEKGAPLLAEADIDFATVSEKWNKYELEQSVRLRMKHTLVKVDRTNQYDEQGMPKYNIESSMIYRLIPPK